MTTELRALKQVLEYFDIDTTNVPEELYKVVFNAVALAIPLHREQGEAYPTQGGDLPSIAEIYSTPLEDKLTEPNRDLFDEAVGYCNKHSLTGKPFEVVHSAFIDGALWQAASQEKGVREAGAEVRDVKLWPPDKNGWYWCIVEGRPNALGKWLLKLEYNKDEGGFLQEDDGYRPIQWLTKPAPDTVQGRFVWTDEQVKRVIELYEYWRSHADATPENIIDKFKTKNS